jgi:hypothetical protein
MKYVPQSTEAARKWVEVCAQSLEISTNEATSIYAQLCGVGTWKSLLETMEVNEPSVTDSLVSPAILIKRREFYTRILVDNFGFNKQISRYISQKLSPSAKHCPNIVSVDLNRLREVHTPSNFLSFNTAADGLEDLVNCCPELIVDNDVDSQHTAHEPVDSLVRLKTRVVPAYWFNLLTSLGWKVTSKSFRKEHSVGKPSFIVESLSAGESIPVYIACMTCYPYDKESPANLTMDLVRRDFEASGYQRAILFWCALTSKRIHGEDYTHPGVVFTHGEWRETLINTSMHDVEDMMACALATPNINKPATCYADKGGALILGFQLMFSRVASLSELKLVGATSPTGWVALVTIEGKPAG